jgi:hypothetical protein
MKKLYGAVSLLVVSEGLGVVLGQIFFGLFEKTVPAAVLTSFNRGTAHAAFIVYGAFAGILIFALALAVLLFGRYLTGSRRGA